jgi:glyoxylase-like metal-dependent hydrolase (beta-lactamase superfamily II)
VTEADLRDLGILRVSVPIPFPEAGGPVNVYVVEDLGGGIALFDSGLGSPEAEAALEAGLAAAGRRFSEVGRIALSHGHVDHYGGARTVVEKAGGAVTVHAHPADTPKIAESGPRWRDLVPRYAAHFARLGVPAEVTVAAGRALGGGLALARRLAEVRPLLPGEVLRFRHFEAEVLHMPGHTPGLLCLWDARHRIFFSGDHLLERISPNPAIDLGPGASEHWRPLLSYLESAGRLHALDVELVLPGHGPPFGNHRQVIDRLVQFYRERQARIRNALGQGPLTAYGVTQALFPWAKPKDLFLTLSEAVANLEVLESRGEVSREIHGEAFQFRLAA